MQVGGKRKKPLNLTEGGVQWKLDLSTCDMLRRKHHDSDK